MCVKDAVDFEPIFTVTHIDLFWHSHSLWASVVCPRKTDLFKKFSLWRHFKVVFFSNTDICQPSQSYTFMWVVFTEFPEKLKTSQSFLNGPDTSCHTFLHMSTKNSEHSTVRLKSLSYLHYSQGKHTEGWWLYESYNHRHLTQLGLMLIGSKPAVTVCCAVLEVGRYAPIRSDPNKKLSPQGFVTRGWCCEAASGWLGLGTKVPG